MKTLKPFLITLVIIIAIGTVFLFVQKSPGNLSDNAVVEKSATSTIGAGNKKTRAKANPVTKAIVSKTLDTVVENEGGQIKEAFDSMSKEDKDTVTEIIAANVSLDAISELSDAAAKNDTDAIMDYAAENLSEEDIEDLQSILEKYNLAP